MTNILKETNADGVFVLDARVGPVVLDSRLLATGDDAFEQYRKRMMMAYRFRPNPLNNPRRAYY